jgi:hypothetical protein
MCIYMCVCVCVVLCCVVLCRVVSCLNIQPHGVLHCICVVLPVIFYIVALLKSHCDQIHIALPMSCFAHIPLQEYNPYILTQNRKGIWTDNRQLSPYIN